MNISQWIKDLVATKKEDPIKVIEKKADIMTVDQAKSIAKEPVEKKAYSGEMAVPSYDVSDGSNASKKSKNVNVINSATIEGMDSVARVYSGFLTPIARYALTKILKANNPQILSDGNLSSKASSTDIEVDVDKIETVADAIHAIYKDMVVVAFEKYGDYNIMCYAKERKQAQEWMAALETKMLKENQYRTKCLHVENGRVMFRKVSATMWDDVILDENTKKDIRMNTVSFLGDAKMAAVGVGKRGILMYGPPGTGKSSICKAVFNELEGKNTTRVYVTAESFRKMSAGSLFDLLPYLGKTVLAFEDLDLLCGSRNDSYSLNGNLLGDLLTNLDGMRTYTDPIVIMASTNKISMMDEALSSRPGRFDRKVEIGLPSMANLKIIYKRFSGLDVSDEILGMSKGFTGSHVVESINTAKILAASESKKLYDCMKEACQIIRDNFFPGQTMSEIKTAALMSLSTIKKSASKVNRKIINASQIASEFIKSKAATVNETDVAKNIIKEVGKGQAKDIIMEEALGTFLKKNYAGVEFHLSELDAIEAAVKKLTKTKKKKASTNWEVGDKVELTISKHHPHGKRQSAGDYFGYADVKVGDVLQGEIVGVEGDEDNPLVTVNFGEGMDELELEPLSTEGDDTLRKVDSKKAEFAEVDLNEGETGYGGDRGQGVQTAPARTMKLESANNYKIDTILELGNRKKIEQTLNKLVEEKVISGYLRGADGKVIILNVSDINKVKEALGSGYPIVKSSEEKKQAAIPPKPTDVPPEGFTYGWDTDSNSWILVKKKASLAEVIAKGVICGLGLMADEKWPGANNSNSTGYVPGFYVQPKASEEPGANATVSVAQKTPEQSDEDLLKVGVQIEHEHLPSYNALVIDVNSNGKITLNIDQFATLIANDHIKEHGAKYYSNQEGLPEMERRLSGVAETVNTNKEVDVKEQPKDQPEVKAPEVAPVPSAEQPSGTSTETKPVSEKLTNI